MNKGIAGGQEHAEHYQIWTPEDGEITCECGSVFVAIEDDPFEQAPGDDGSGLRIVTTDVDSGFFGKYGSAGWNGAQDVD